MSQDTSFDTIVGSIAMLNMHWINVEISLQKGTITMIDSRSMSSDFIKYYKFVGDKFEKIWNQMKMHHNFKNKFNGYDKINLKSKSRNLYIQKNNVLCGSYVSLYIAQNHCNLNLQHLNLKIQKDVQFHNAILLLQAFYCTAAYFK